MKSEARLFQMLLLTAAWGLTPAIASASSFIAQLQSPLNDKCLDADPNHLGEDGGRVQLWDCNGAPHQSWIFTPDDLSWRIQSLANPTKCLDADLNHLGEDGARVQLWDCNDTDQQRWFDVIQANVQGIYLFNMGSGLRYLDADNQTPRDQNGGVVQLWSFNGNDNQRWILNRR